MQLSDTVQAAEKQADIQTQEVDRRSQITISEFEDGYLAGTGRPVVVTDAMQKWPARTKWTFAFFAEKFGSQVVIVTDRLGQAKAARKVRFDDYVTYCQLPKFSSLSQHESEFPFYLTNFSPFGEHPELLSDFDQPYFIRNIYSDLTGEFKRWYLEGFSWIFIGPKGTLSPFHIDLFGTHAWLAQLHGTKDFILVPPVREGESSGGPHLRAPFRCTLQPGEVIFIPAGWAHQVISMEPSISLTFNFVNESNYLRHIMAISKDLPAWTQKVSKSGLPSANKQTWISKGFEVVSGERIS